MFFIKISLAEDVVSPVLLYSCRTVELLMRKANNPDKKKGGKMILHESGFERMKKDFPVTHRNHAFITLCFLYAIHCCVPSTYAKSDQPVYGSFKGIAADERTIKPVQGAIVTILQSDLKAISDSTGIFIFGKVPVGIYTIMISASGYDTLITNNVHIKAKRNAMREFSLAKSGTVASLARMVVRTHSKLHKTTQSNSVTRFDIYEMNNTPAAFNDINRILATSPSAVMQGDPSYMNGITVRGGNPAENVYMLDGFELENPNHFANYQSSSGAVGFINSNLVKSIDFYAGGYPAVMSPGLSSVTAITFRSGSLTERIHAVDLGITGLGLTTEGPFLKSRGSYIISGRMVNTRFLRFFISSLPVMPSWEDAFVKSSVHLDPDNELTLLWAGAGDQLRMIDASNRFEADGGDFYAQSIGGVKWRLSKSTMTNCLYVSGRYLKFREYWDLTEKCRDQWRFNHLLDRDWRKYTAQLKDHFTFYLGDDQLDGGASAEKIWYKRFNRDDARDYPVWRDLVVDSLYLSTRRDTVHTIGDTLHFESGYIEQPRNVYRNSGEHFGGFLQYTLVVNPFKMIAGLRNDYYTLLHEHGFSPRLAIVVEPGQIGRLSLSGGLYHQFPSYLNNIVTDSVYKSHLNTCDLQRCRQSSAGYERLFGKDHLFRMETYLKWYDHEFVYSDPTGPDLDSIQYNDRQNGKRRVAGVELQFGKRRYDTFYYSFSYSFVFAENRYTNNKWYADGSVFRNVGKVLIGTNVFKHHGIACNLVVCEGLPYTRLGVNTSTKVDPDGTVRRVPYYTYPDESEWNSKRRKSYITLGLRYDFKVYRKWGNFTGYIDIANILNNTPVVDEILNTETGELEKQYAPGILPMFGVMIDF